MVLRNILVLASVVLLSACVGTKTDSWQSPELDGTGWVNYGWNAPALTDKKKYSDNIRLIDEAVRAAANSQLSRKGYKENPEAAQFRLDYRVGSEASVGQLASARNMSATEIAERQWQAPLAEYEVSSRFYTAPSLGYQTTSHLKLTILDVSTGKIVWEGLASRMSEHDGVDSSKTRSKIGNAVDKLMSGFPSVK
ncbi:MAG: DUF4136 domain-containing protein [Pseudomonadales bacterium]